MSATGSPAEPNRSLCEFPVLRRPTRFERLVFAVTKRWPESYVEARLSHNDAVSAALAKMEPHDAIRVLMDQSPYEAGARRA